MHDFNGCEPSWPPTTTPRRHEEREGGRTTRDCFFVCDDASRRSEVQKRMWTGAAGRQASRKEKTTRKERLPAVVGSGAGEVGAEGGEFAEELLLDLEVVLEGAVLLDEGEEEEDEEGDEPGDAVDDEDGVEEAAAGVEGAEELRQGGGSDDGGRLGRRNVVAARVALGVEEALAAVLALGPRGEVGEVGVGGLDVGLVEAFEVGFGVDFDAALPDRGLGPGDLELEADARLAAVGRGLGHPAVLDGEAVAVGNVFHGHDRVHHDAAPAEAPAPLHFRGARRRRPDRRLEAPPEAHDARVLAAVLRRRFFLRHFGPGRHAHLGVALELVELGQRERRVVREEVLEELVDRDRQRRRRQLVRQRSESRDVRQTDQ
mmetsp:Transcript_18210/g.55824  ORF Transcript_18210/g.55824 Transcript_18210/m.55824 type:complete len:374 (+) Transcript_18210:70-1191(+)